MGALYHFLPDDQTRFFESRPCWYKNRLSSSVLSFFVYKTRKKMRRFVGRDPLKDDGLEESWRVIDCVRGMETSVTSIIRQPTSCRYIQQQFWHVWGITIWSESILLWSHEFYISGFTRWKIWNVYIIVWVFMLNLCQDCLCGMIHQSHILSLGIEYEIPTFIP